MNISVFHGWLLSLVVVAVAVAVVVVVVVVVVVAVVLSKYTVKLYWEIM